MTRSIHARTVFFIALATGGGCGLQQYAAPRDPAQSSATPCVASATTPCTQADLPDLRWAAEAISSAR